MKIALVQAPLWGISTPPLALASLSAYLRRRGHKVLVRDLNIDLYKRRSQKNDCLWQPERIEAFWADPRAAAAFAQDNRAYFEGQAELILASGAKIAGFSVHQSSIYLSLYLAELLKRKNKKIITVFGGFGASRELAGKTLVEDGNVDFIVQGEGELTLTEIVENKNARNFCKGALIRKNGKVIDCGDRELIKDLDSLPFPDFSDYDLSCYTGPFKLPIGLSRGCCNNCNYCYEHFYWKSYRSRTAANIYSELLFQLKKHPGERLFSFQDSLVNGNVKELEKLAGLIIKNGLKIYWYGQAVIRKEMTYPLLLKLKKAGCTMLAYGLETASVPLMLKTGKLLAKDSDPGKILRDGYRAGLVGMVNFMFGLPGEKEEDFRKTLEFVKKNEKYIGIVNPMPNFCSLHQGTYAHDHPAELGIELEDGAHWRAKDGSNNYLVRLRRFEELCKLAWKLKIPSSYPAPRLINRNELLGGYHLYAGELQEAARYFLRAVKTEGLDSSALGRLEPHCQKAGLRDLYKNCVREAADWKKSAKTDKTNRPLERFERERAKIAAMMEEGLTRMM